MVHPTSLGLSLSFEWTEFHSGEVLGLYFSTDGQLLAVTAADCKILLFSTSSGRPLVCILLDAGVLPLHILWTRADRLLLTTSDGLVTEWTIYAGEAKATAELTDCLPNYFPAPVHHLAYFDKAATKLLLACYGGTCEVWELQKGSWTAVAQVSIEEQLVIGAWFLSGEDVLVAYRKHAPSSWTFREHRLSPIHGWTPAETIHGAQLQSETELLVFLDHRMILYNINWKPCLHILEDRVFPYPRGVSALGHVVRWGPIVVLL